MALSLIADEMDDVMGKTLEELEHMALETPKGARDLPVFKYKCSKDWARLKQAFSRYLAKSNGPVNIFERLCRSDLHSGVRLEYAGLI
jgi:hypothetical protein